MPRHISKLIKFANIRLQQSLHQAARHLKRAEHFATSSSRAYAL